MVEVVEVELVEVELVEGLVSLLKIEDAPPKHMSRTGHREATIGPLGACNIVYFDS